MPDANEFEDSGKAMQDSLDETEGAHSRGENLEPEREEADRVEQEEVTEEEEEKNDDEEVMKEDEEEDEEDEEEETESEDEGNNVVHKEEGNGQGPGSQPKQDEVSDNDDEASLEDSDDEADLDEPLSSRGDHIKLHSQMSDRAMDQDFVVDRSLGPGPGHAHDPDYDRKGGLSEREIGISTLSSRHQVNGAPHVSSPALKVENMKDVETNNDANMKEGATPENRNSSPAFICEADSSEGWDSGTEEEQNTFMKDLEKFCRESGADFRPPKFYGEPLNLLKLWNATIKLGGYDKVTGCKLWRIVGESFKPPKTCTTVSWTFRIFYEKALLDFERYKARCGDLSIPVSISDTTTANQAGNNQAYGSGRARRDAAARAMQGWHSQRLLNNGEVSDPIIKDRSSIALQKREKQLKGMLKRKKPVPGETPVKIPRINKLQLDSNVTDVAPPADWVKINVRTTKDCYEVYALVPGLLREEVRVQSDPAGRLVITGEPEDIDNPWGVTPFKKMVNLPSRIDPYQTSAVVTLHGQLFVRVPFEQSD